MSEEIPGPFRCGFDTHSIEQREYLAEQRRSREEIRDLNANIKVVNDKVDTIGKWAASYIDRTMPIKSHFYILLGSLSILGTFAAVMQYLDKALGH
jgi:hypothetical protein